MRTLSTNVLFFRFFVIDTLFTPFFLPVPISVFVWPFWFIMQLSNRQVKLQSLSVAAIGIIFSIASFILGLSETGVDQEMIQDRFLFTGVICYMFATYITVENCAVDDSRFLTRILILYLLFSTALAILFIINPQTFFSVRSFWTFSGDVTDIAVISIITRFTGLLSDPNNMAVATCAISAFIIFNHKNVMSVNFLILLMTSIIVVSTMSATGLICLIILVLAFIFVARFSENASLNTVWRFGAVLGMAFAFLILWYALKDTIVFNLALERLEQSDADSRFSRWAIIGDGQKIISSILFGDGGTIIWQGLNYKPHNGHFHVFFSFGLIAYICFCWIFFRVKDFSNMKGYLFLLILFIGFTVNVGIYEPRFAGIWVILVSYIHGAFSATVPVKARQYRVPIRKTA